MADYPIESQLVITTDGKLIPGGKVYVYDSDDTANTTLLALTDPNGLPIPNPITTSALSTTPEIRTPVLLVKMVGENGAQLTVLSAKGVVEKAEAAASDAAASKSYVMGIDVAGTTTLASGAPAAVTFDQATGKFSFDVPTGPKGDKGDRGDMGPAGSADDSSVSALLTTPGTQTKAVLSSGFVAKVQPPSGGDDTAAIQSALDAARDAGGGEVRLSAAPETAPYLTNMLTIYSNVSLVGAGRKATVVKLRNGQNTDLLRSLDADTLNGSGSSGGVTQVALRDLTLDGNKANNTGSGVGFRHYGSLLQVERVVIRNCAGDGVASGWSNSAVLPDGCEGHVLNLITHHNGRNGVTWAGPHDSKWTSCISFQNGAKGFHIAPGAAIHVAVNCHSWGLPQTHAWYIEAQAHLIGCQGEGGSAAQVFVGANDCQILGGKYFAGDGSIMSGTKGVVIGDATHPSITGTNVNTYIVDCQSGAVDMTNSGGGGEINSRIYQTAGVAQVGQTKTNELCVLRVSGIAGSVYSVPSSMTIAQAGANGLLVIGSQQMFNINGSAKTVLLPNGTQLIGYADGYATEKLRLDSATGVATAGVVRDKSVALLSGEETMPRMMATNVGLTVSSGQLLLSYFTAAKGETVSGVRLFSGNVAAAATPTLIRVGVYSVAQNGDLTLVASTPNDTALLAGVTAAYSKAFDAPLAKLAGQRYAIGVLIVSSATMPRLVGCFPGGGIGSEVSQSPRLAGAVNGLSDLPASVAAASVAGNGGMHYAVLTP